MSERPPLPPFVAPAWVAEHRDELVLVDVRWYLDDRDGAEAHRAGHLPGAVFVDLDTALAGQPGPGGRHPLPEPERFAAALGRAGIGDDDRIVAYDDAGGAVAARLVWMLRVTGRAAAVLDGGLQAWCEAVDGDLEQGPVRRPTAELTPRPWPPSRLADADEIAALRPGADTVLVDARDPARYRGEEEPVDPRAGHIPGAVSLPYRDNLDDTGRIAPPAALRRRLEAAGVTDARDVVVYCGSGVTACHDVLAMERAGVVARLYPGSWSEWSRDPDRPVAAGSGPAGVDRVRGGDDGRSRV